MSAYALRPMSLPMSGRTMQLKAPGDYNLREHATPPPSRSGAVDVYQPYDMIERPSVEYPVDPYNPNYESPAPYLDSVEPSPAYFYPQTVQIPTRGVKRAVSPSAPSRPTKSAASPSRPKSSRGQSRPKSSRSNKGNVQQLISAPLSELTRGMTHIPIRNMEAWVNRSTSVRMREVAAKKGKIARPMNSFMLYRSAYAERTKEWCSQNNHQIVSRVSGQSWPLEPRNIRDVYERLAIQERENHKKAHPDYKFAPNKTTPVTNGSHPSPVNDSLVASTLPPSSSSANKKKRAYNDHEESDLDDPDFTIGGYTKAASQSPRKRTRFTSSTLRPSTPVARPATAAASYNTIYDSESYAPPVPTYANPFINLPHYSMLQPHEQQQQQQFYDFLDTDHLGVALPRQAVQEEQKQKQQQQQQQQYSSYPPFTSTSSSGNHQHSLYQVDPRMLEYEHTVRPHTADAALGSSSLAAGAGAGSFDQIPPLFEEDALQESIIPQSSPVLRNREPEAAPASPTLSQRSAPTAHSLWPTDGFAAEVSADIDKWLA